MPAFVDTNVLVYCTDTTSPEKQRKARELVARLAAAGEAVLSTLVLIELFHTLTRKQGMPQPSARTLTYAYAQWPVVDSNASLVKAAVDRSVEHKLSIWDAMVVEAALRAKAETLYSEDLSDGQRFGKLRVVDPFR